MTRPSRALRTRAAAFRMEQLAKAVKPAEQKKEETGFAPTSGFTSTDRVSSRRYESWDGGYRVAPTPMAVGFQPNPPSQHA